MKNYRAPGYMTAQELAYKHHRETIKEPVNTLHEKWNIESYTDFMLAESIFNPNGKNKHLTNTKSHE